MLDSIDLLESISEENSSNQNLQNQLLQLVESLYEELETERKTIDNLHKQIEDLMKQEVFAVTSKYLAFKEKCETLQQQCSSLKNENEDLNYQLIAQEEELNRKMAEREQEIHNDYSVALSKKDEQLAEIQKELQNNKHIYEKRQQDLYGEMQAVAASSTLEVDAVEARFKKQLAESNQQLRETMETCNILRKELMSTKEQFAQYKYDSNQRISGLQKRFRDVQLQAPKNLAKVDDCDTDDSRSISSVSTKYTPLDVSHERFVDREKTPVYKKPIVYRGSGQFLSESARFVNKKNKHLTANQRDVVEPEEINVEERNDVSDSADNKTVRPIPRKRKLYNPNNFSPFDLD